MFNNQYVILILFLSLCLSNFSSSIKVGYDSNILKYSDNENPISSDLIQFSGSYIKKINILERKTRFTINFKKSNYKLSEKSNYSIGIRLKQPLGKYRFISFSYNYIDNIYLRKYVDVDQGVLDHVYTATNCSFDNTRINLNYEFPMFTKKSKINLYYLHETQFYNKYFTEFDLKSNGFKIRYSHQIKNKKYSFSISYNDSKNITLNDLTLSTSYMDRGYTESGCNITYKYNQIGFSINIFNRDYSSNIIEDQLHLNRAHKDIQYYLGYSFYLFNTKNKLVFKYRQRNTSSPYNWVSALKTFDKFNLEHSIYF